MADLHQHNEHCECGCDHDHEQEVQYMTLQTEDGQELKCAVIGIFDVEEIEGKEYIALVPDDSDEALVYEYIETEGTDGFKLNNIESDEEFKIVENALMDMLVDECDEDFNEEDYEFEELEDEE